MPGANKSIEWREPDNIKGNEGLWILKATAYDTSKTVQFSSIYLYGVLSRDHCWHRLEGANCRITPYNKVVSLMFIDNQQVEVSSHFGWELVFMKSSMVKLKCKTFWLVFAKSWYVDNWRQHRSSIEKFKVLVENKPYYKNNISAKITKSYCCLYHLQKNIFNFGSQTLHTWT